MPRVVVSLMARHYVTPFRTGWARIRPPAGRFAMTWMTHPESWIALLTLTVLEIVLGIDNVIFISILAGKLPSERQGKARRLGLFLAMFIRIGLLASLAWVVSLTRPLAT